MNRLLSILGALLLLTSCLDGSSNSSTTTEDPILNIPYMLGEPLTEVVAEFTAAGYLSFPFMIDGASEEALASSETQIVLPRADADGNVESILSCLPVVNSSGTITYTEVFETYHEELYAAYDVNPIEFSCTLDGVWCEYESPESMLEAIAEVGEESLTEALALYEVEIGGVMMTVEIPYFMAISQLSGNMVSGYYTGLWFKSY